MSESPAATARSVSTHYSTKVGTADLRMLAEVEKWMAMIREINRQQAGL